MVFLLLLLPLFNTLCIAQSKKVNIQVEMDHHSQSWLEKEFNFDSAYPDSIQMLKGLEALVNNLHDASYLEASMDSLIRIDSTSFASFIYVGQPYQWIKLDPGNVPENWLDKSGFRQKLFKNQAFSFVKFLKLKENILKEAENNGYPFAKISISNLEIHSSNLSGELRVEKDSLVLIKELKIRGDVKINPIYVENYLGIKPNNPYDHSKILRIKNRLQELPFLETSNDPTITFFGNQAQINLELKKKRSSQFDFIIGVLPNNVERDGLQITGTFKGELMNQLGQGERIFLEYEQLRPETQQLDIEFNYPYVLNLPFGADLSFNLYKRDSTYLDIESDFGIQYLLDGGNYIKAFWNNSSSRLLTINEQRLLRNQTQDLDYNQATFGLEFLQERLDYRYNPRKGWSAFLKAGAGTKRIKRNQQIEELALEINPYDSIQLRTFQYQFDTKLSAYIPFFQRSTLKFEFTGGAIFSESPIYRNEQYRIGGNQLMRGYDEESLFVTRYLILTTEYRFLIGQNSYLYAFGDFGYTQNITSTTDKESRPQGFGAGITFETKVGLFGLTLAFGKQQNTFDLGAPKVHFGYVSLF